ncbi:MAG TPA: putative glycoside hydrolase [Patescibacteria group bacterium]|nr:putative glycoside hydrolase [Patescibacteria group bacterium]
MLIHRSLFILFLSSLVSLFLIDVKTAGATSHPFVRTANHFLVAGPDLEKPTTLDELAKFDLIVLPAEAQRFNPSFFSEIRKRNPDILILAYVPSVSFNDRYWTDALHQSLRAGIKDEWWLRDERGNLLSLWPGTTALNLASGWPEYLAHYAAESILSTGYWDGIFYDEVSGSISWMGNVDTDRDGTVDHPATADARWSDGNVRLFSLTRQLVGSKPILVTNGSSDAPFQPYVNGRMFESFPTPWEGDGAWKTVMSHYLTLEDTVGYDPVFLINGNTNNTGNGGDYQHMRFGLTSTLLGDGYFTFDYGTEGHAQLWRYDEYEASLGLPKGNPENLLNTSASFREGTPVPESVWTRDFSHGKAIVNATAQSQTVRLDGDYEKIRGIQDPAVNNGSVVSRVTLRSQDGIILLRPLETIVDAVFSNGTFARIFDTTGKAKRAGFFAYDAAYHGGQRIISADLDGNGTRETVVANDTEVSIYASDGKKKSSFQPYGSSYRQGINLAVGDLENDGKMEIVTGTKKGGGPQVRIFDRDGKLVHAGFFAYDEKFRGGVQVAIGDTSGDGINEIVVGAGVGGGPHVRIFNRDGKLLNPGFFAYDEKFRGGVQVALGDVNSDGKDEIITGPGPGGGPHVRIFTGNGSLLTQFFASDASERNGIDVAAADLDGDGNVEVIGMSSDVFTFSAVR